MPQRETASADLQQLTMAFAESTGLHWRECAVVVAQVEGEFPGKAREVFEEAAELADRVKNPGGMIETMMWVILHRRETGKPYDMSKIPVTPNKGAQ